MTRPGQLRLSPPRVVVVRSVTVPRYLDRQEIVRIGGPDRLVAASNDWWAEPLRVMARRVMAEDLAQRLPDARVLAGDGAIGGAPDAEVEIEVERFESDGAGQVTLAGFAAVTVHGITVQGTTMQGGGGGVERLRADVPAAGGVAGEVDAMSVALGQAADRVAARLAP